MVPAKGMPACQVTRILKTQTSEQLHRLASWSSIKTFGNISSPFPRKWEIPEEADTSLDLSHPGNSLTQKAKYWSLESIHKGFSWGEAWERA